MKMSVKGRRHKQFTSPLQKSTTDKEESEMALQDKLKQLNKDIRALQSQGFKEEELKLHIEKMHEYNQLKDVGQAVLGQLATLRGVRVQDIYKCYGLEMED